MPVNPSGLIADYLMDAQDLEAAMDHVFEDDDEVRSLKNLKAKKAELFPILKASKVVSCILKYFPELVLEIKSEFPRWFSSRNMLHKVIHAQDTLNALLVERAEFLSPSAVYRERLQLISNGYLEVGFDILPFLDDQALQIELLLFIVICCKKNGLSSLKNSEKIIKFSSLIQDESVRVWFFIEVLRREPVFRAITERIYVNVISMVNEAVKAQFFSEFFQLPVSEEIQEKAFRYLIIKMSEPQYDLITKISLLNALVSKPQLSQEQRDDILHIARTTENLDEKELTLTYFFGHRAQIVTHEELDEVFLILKLIEDQNIVTRLLIHFLKFLGRRLSSDERIKFVTTADDMKGWNRINILLQLYKFGSSEEERAELFEIVRGLKDKYKKEILKQLYKFELSLKERKEIFEIIKEMKDKYKAQILDILSSLCQQSLEENEMFLEIASTIRSKKHREAIIELLIKRIEKIALKHSEVLLNEVFTEETSFSKTQLLLPEEVHASIARIVEMDSQDDRTNAIVALLTANF